MRIVHLSGDVQRATASGQRLGPPEGKVIHGARVGEGAELEDSVLVRGRNRASRGKLFLRAGVVSSLEVDGGCGAREERAGERRALANLGQDSSEQTRNAVNTFWRD
jgi:hypothetical protein